MSHDSLLLAHSPSTRLRFALVQALGVAKVLERRHLSGPSAAQVLAQGVVAAALLSQDLAAPAERLLLQLKVNGPVGGMMAEVGHGGEVRGYTYAKVMNELDGEALSDLAPALGENGGLTVIRSDAESTLVSGSVHATPPCIRAATARYCNESLQRPTGVALESGTDQGYLSCAAGLLVEKMPDGDTETFVRVLEAFADGSVSRALREGVELAGFAELFALPDLAVTELRPLRFGCRCSATKIADLLRGMEEDELAEIDAEGNGQEVFCHFCGEGYRVKAEAIRQLLVEKRAKGV